MSKTLRTHATTNSKHMLVWHTAVSATLFETTDLLVLTDWRLVQMTVQILARRHVPQANRGTVFDFLTVDVRSSGRLFVGRTTKRAHTTTHATQRNHITYPAEQRSPSTPDTIHKLLRSSTCATAVTDCCPLPLHNVFVRSMTQSAREKQKRRPPLASVRKQTCCRTKLRASATDIRCLRV